MNKNNNNLEVKIAENYDELDAALSLRFDVFNLELCEGLPESYKLERDIDEYDSKCDHIIVIDHNIKDKKGNGKIVGTYRAINGNLVGSIFGDYYSASEFNLGEGFYKHKNKITELGRTSIDKNYRNSAVMSLLFKGLANHMKKNNLRYFIGCGSIHSLNPIIINEIYKDFLKKDKLIQVKEFLSTPKKNNSFEFEKIKNINSIENIKNYIPSLINMYFLMGSKICSEPAKDEIFKTSDFLLLFDRQKANPRVKKHYNL